MGLHDSAMALTPAMVLHGGAMTVRWRVACPVMGGRGCTAIALLSSSTPINCIGSDYHVTTVVLLLPWGRLGIHMGMPQHGSGNPTAVLRDLLSQCQGSQCHGTAMGSVDGNFSWHAMAVSVMTPHGTAITMP